MQKKSLLFLRGFPSLFVFKAKTYGCDTFHGVKMVFWLVVFASIIVYNAQKCGLYQDDFAQKILYPKSKKVLRISRVISIKRGGFLKCSYQNVLLCESTPFMIQFRVMFHACFALRLQLVPRYLTQCSLESNVQQIMKLESLNT